MLVRGVLSTLALALAASPAAAADETPVHKWNAVGFSNPESVYVPEGWDRAVVSSISGEALEKDGDGFLSLLTLDGEIETLRWVEGLNAPKGMRAHDGVLYVADIDEVVSIDLESGEIIGRVTAPGAEFLNDVAVAENGTIYVSDMLRGGVYRIQGGEAEFWASGDIFTRANGLLTETDRLLVLTISAGAVLSVDYETGDASVLADGLGALDGIEKAREGEYFLSDISGALHHLSDDGAVITFADSREAGIGANDLGYHAATGTILLARYGMNAVSAYGPPEE